VHAVDDKFVVQVGPGCQPGGAHVANGLALIYLLALLYRTVCEVQILGYDAVGMFDKDMVAIGT